MAQLKSYRTSDVSKKITTYLFCTKSETYAFDFGSNDIPLKEVERIKYIFITHEHLDHFMGLYNKEYVEILLKSNCHIYCSKITKELIIAIFEYNARVNFDEKTVKLIRQVLNRIEGNLFFEKIHINKECYFKLFPSGHTFGSSMIYLHHLEKKILYTGDFDYSNTDEDRQYHLDFDDNEAVDYIIADGTYLDSKKSTDKSLSIIKDSILKRKHNSFYCKPEKIIFIAKKLIALKELKENYCFVLGSEIKWYLKIIEKYNYNPFVYDEIVLDIRNSGFELPPDRVPLFISPNKKEKQTNLTGLVGLHISFFDFSIFLQNFDSSKTKVLIGHYEDGNENDITRTFVNDSIASCFDGIVLKEGATEI